MNKMIRMLLLLFLTNMGFGQVSDAFITKNTDFKITQKGQYASVESNRSASSTTKVGAPELPVISRSYYLPAGSIVTDVQFNNGNKVLAGSNLILYPAQPPCPLNGRDCPDFVVPDPSIYDISTPYPEKTAVLGSDATIYGYHMVTVDICPFEYVPKEKKLYFYDEIHISIQYTIGQEEYQVRITERRNELTKDIVRSFVENPTLITSTAKTATVIWDTDNQPPTRKLIIPWKPSAYGDVPDYIIITNEALKPSFEPLVTYKIQKGIPTLLTTVEQIYANYPGSDNAEKIRNYIKAAHHYWGAGLYILLGGDTAVIPARIGTNDGELRNTDMYYCDVYKPGNSNYTWNADNDADFGWDPGEILDLGPDNIIGRAPVDTADETQNFIQKVISYENLSNVTDTAYVNNNLFFGPYFFLPPSCNGDTGQRWANTSINQPFWATISNINKWKMYDDYTPGVNNVYCNTYPGDEELTRPTTLERLNNGHPVNGLNFHIIGHVDHGSPYGIGVSSKLKGHSLYREDMDDLSNGSNYQILYTGCCDAGEYDKDCFAEHFVNNTHGGGVAALANSGYGWPGSQNQEAQLFKSIYDTTIINGHVLGIAALKSRLAYLNNKNIINNLNLLGEPSMTIWSNTPQAITLTVPANVTINNTIQNILPVTINALTEKATVTLYKFNNVTNYIEVYSSQYLLPGDTDAEFVLHPDTEGVMMVKVTAKNYLPATANVNILLPQAHLYVTGYSITDSNGDGVVEQGETVSLSVSLTNSGNTDITGINTILSCNPAFAGITANQVSYPQINAGQTVLLNTYTFVAQISNGTIEFPDFIEFYLHITADGSYSHHDNFYVDFRNPVLTLGARNMSNSAGPITSFSLSENVFLNITLNNTGNIATGPLTATLTSPLTADGIIVITEGTRTYPNLGVFASEHNTLPFEFHLAQPHSGAKPFTLTLTNPFGKTWTFNFDLNEPQPPLISNFHFTSTKDEIKLMWNSIPNIMGYNIYRSDTEVDGYSKINDFLVGASVYTDVNVSNTTIYYYKISVVTLSGNERLLEQVVTTDSPPKQGYKAWTSLDFHAGFPTEADGQNGCNSSATLYDVNGDGKKEIFINYAGSNEGLGKIMGFRESGQELFNLDGNETTVSGFAVTNIAMMSNSAVGDLDNDGLGDVLSIGRNNALNQGKMSVYKTTDLDNNNNPDTFWPDEVIDLGWRTWRNPVLYDVDGNGFLDIIVVDEKQTVYVFDKDKNLMPGWPIVTGTNDYSMGHIAVADLDHDGKGEIALGMETGNGVKGAIYIWKHDGTPFTVNPFKEFSDNERADSGIVFADIDNDLNLDILITTRKVSTGRIYAFKQDGTPLNAAWNGTTSFPCQVGTYSDHVIPRIAVGDLNGDANLEVSFGSAGSLFVLNKDGVSIAGYPKAISDIGDHAPILADIDTDAEVEVVVNDAGVIRAFDFDGSTCVGFPLVSQNGSNFMASPAIDDLDGDGKNEIVISTQNANTYVYKTEGSSDHIEWGSYRGNTHNTGTYREVCDGLDLYVKDSAEDTGEEPNTMTPYMWASNNIWIRNNDDGGLDHQNPEYGAPNYAKIRVINKSCVASSGDEHLTFYWAKASAYLSWPNPWNGGIQYPVTGASMGEESGTLTIPVLQPGEEVILTFPWEVPDPSLYGDDGDQWHFCLLARITGDTDPITYPEDWDLNANVRNNNNLAWKNVTVVDVLPNNIVEPGGVVAIGNSFSTPKSYYLEMLVDDQEVGMPIYEAAEVTLEMDKAAYTVWMRGGAEVYKLDPTPKNTRKIIRANRARLKNLNFEGNEMGKIKFNINFLTKKVTAKTNFVFHVLQRDTRSHDIIGGETFYINKTDRSPFKADAGDDKEVDWNQPLTINAEDINEPALYNWYNSNGELIFEGKDLQIAKAVAERYKLEVISTVDGYKDYTEVEVKLKPNRLESISPNPASNNINVHYKLNEAGSAYLMIVSYYITGGVSNNYVLDLNSSQTNINISNYPNGFYKVVLVVNGQVADAKLLFKQ